MSSGSNRPAIPAAASERLRCDQLTLAFGLKVILQDITFSVRQGSVFAVMGGSGCGKSTVLRALIGLLRPARGSVLIDGEDIWAASAERRAEICRGFGMSFQNGALWSSMTVGDNVALPLRMFTRLDGPAIGALVRLKLSLVGISAAASKMPAELSETGPSSIRVSQSGITETTRA